MSEQTNVIVGASLAGAKAAQALRENGFGGRVVLIGAEPDPPYERPELSKAFLLGSKELADLLVHPEGFYADHDIELHTGTTVTRIDRGAGQVHMDDGGPVSFDQLLLATGAVPRTLPVPGAGLPGVHQLRTVADSLALREAIPAAGRVVIVGAGWIGCEVAAAARTLGVGVDMLTPDEYPLVRVLGPQVGEVVRDLHADHGVRLHLGVGVDAIVGGDRAEGVRLSDGRVLDGDLVVMGVGAAPRDDLARTAGLEVDNGVVVDEYLRSSDPRIFAAGDVANAWHPLLGARLRVEHWDTAAHQGSVAGANMAGVPTAYEKIPFFYSDQYDFGMEYRGHGSGSDQVVLRGDPATRQFLAFWLRDGLVVAGMNANVWDAGEAVYALLRSRATVQAGQLADPDVDLGGLAGP